MRKRRPRNRTSDPILVLQEIHTRFSTAYWIQSDSNKALEIRMEAEPILHEYPELRESVPGRIGKNAFIDWDRFINYPETLNMER